MGIPVIFHVATHGMKSLVPVPFGRGDAPAQRVSGLAPGVPVRDVVRPHRLGMCWLSFPVAESGVLVP